MTGKTALAVAVASVLLLAAAGTAVADSGGQEGATATGHATHQMQDGSQMQGAGMDHSTHQMQDGSQMQGAGMNHGSHRAGTTGVADRPRALALGGFALANVIVLLAAVAVRHRDRSRSGRGRAVAGGAR